MESLKLEGEGNGLPVSTPVAQPWSKFESAIVE